MNRKILSAAVLALAATLSAPLAQADRGYRGDDRDAYREVRVQRVERYYNRDDHDTRHDRGEHRGWYMHNHHGDRDYYEPAPRGYRESYSEQRASSPVPIIAGSVIGGVVGHEIGRGDPGDTAVGAVIGTIIGYEIVRNH
ncbi:glycine zipper 2TM domain-containing protein [Sulfuricaulis sp.]|jgi:hypothetical protein|uniref:glycine zipper 2TM domain-containing protein n=1 Tax=Sulfuricaulis sp. TaxID=2003553 RepID=UPI00355A5A83